MAQMARKPRRDPQESGVLTKAVLRAASNLDIPNRILGAVLGLSEATVSRARNGRKEIEPSEKAFELGALFVRLYRSLDAIAGGDDAVSTRWLRNRNAALNAVPLDMIQSVQGLIGVIQYLDSRRAVL